MDFDDTDILYEIYGYGLGKVGHRINRPLGSRKWFYK